MINIINNKTLHDTQLELGAREGLEVFTTRCIGKTTGQSLELIGQLMQGKQQVVDLKFTTAEVKQYIAHRLDQMGLVGFIWEGDNLSYYPFKEYQDVKEIVHQVTVQVSPFDGKALSPRSYSVVEHTERPTVRVPSLEESYGKVCRTFS